jgi:hypothetical protein
VLFREVNRAKWLLSSVLKSYEHRAALPLNQRILAAHKDTDSLELAVLKIEEVAIAHVDFVAANSKKLDIKLRGATFVLHIHYVHKILVYHRREILKGVLEHPSDTGVASLKSGECRLDGKDCVFAKAVENRRQISAINTGEKLILDHLKIILVRFEFFFPTNHGVPTSVPFCLS